MSLKAAVVAVLCSAILSIGLAVGLGNGGVAGAAGESAKASSDRTLKAIQRELEDLNNAVGNPSSNHTVTVIGLLTEICENTDELNGDTGFSCTG